MPDLRSGTRACDAGVVANEEWGEAVGAACVRLLDGWGYVGHDTPVLGIVMVDPVHGQGVGTTLPAPVPERVPHHSPGAGVHDPAVRLGERFGSELAARDETATMLRWCP